MSTTRPEQEQEQEQQPLFPLKWNYEDIDGTPSFVLLTEEDVRVPSFALRSQMRQIVSEHTEYMRSVEDQHRLNIESLDEKDPDFKRSVEDILVIYRDEIARAAPGFNRQVLAALLRGSDVKNKILSEEFQATCDMTIPTKIISYFRRAMSV